MTILKEFAKMPPPICPFCALRACAGSPLTGYALTCGHRTCMGLAYSKQ